MNPLRLVLADDQIVVRAGMSMVLESQPDLTIVGEADNGRQLVALARQLKPDLVMTDIRMPLMDGIEATQLLAGPDVADPIPVLVLTTFDLDEYVLGALQAGASGFLLKDARPADLIGAIRTVAGGEALVSPAVTRRLIGNFGERLRTSPPPPPSDGPLSRRETEVLILLARGLSNAEIADRLFLSRETIKTFVSRILTKLDLRDRVQAVIYAYRLGLVSPVD